MKDYIIFAAKAEHSLQPASVYMIQECRTFSERIWMQCYDDVYSNAFELKQMLKQTRCCKNQFSHLQKVKTACYQSKFWKMYCLWASVSFCCRHLIPLKGKKQNCSSDSISEISKKVQLQLLLSQKFWKYQTSIYYISQLLQNLLILRRQLL